MLINLTQPPTALTMSFLTKALAIDDELMVSSQAAHLALVESPLPNKAYIRVADSNKFGADTHPSWTIIDDIEWTHLLIKHDKTVAW